MRPTPDIIFIIPYRDREQQLRQWIEHMLPIMEQTEYTYEVIVVHQVDKRKFNRGGMKNIGFLQVKKLYPTTYRDITLVFNDVDTMTMKPRAFKTQRGIVKHMFGFNFAFGGVFSMTAGDFEMIGGFPNLWSWGLEDNIIKERWVKHFGEHTIDWTEFVGLRGKTPEEVAKDYIYDTTAEVGRLVEVQIGQYVAEMRNRNKMELLHHRPISESIHSIIKANTRISPIQSILKTMIDERIKVCNVESFDCGTTDDGLYERRKDLRKIKRHKILTMGQLMRFNNQRG